MVALPGQSVRCLGQGSGDRKPVMRDPAIESLAPVRCPTPWPVSGERPTLPHYGMARAAASLWRRLSCPMGRTLLYSVPG